MSRVSCQGVLLCQHSYSTKSRSEKCQACAGLVYGLYLTLSSWVLFHVATDTTFFTHMHLADLTTTGDRLRGYCLKVGSLHSLSPADF